MLNNGKMRFLPTIHQRQAQRGMTLIVGLILLVMLMVISVIGFRNTTLSERMTGNAVDRNVSFQAAESAGKEALQVIESAGFAAANAGHYVVPFAGGSNSNFWTKISGSAGDVCTAATTRFSWISTSCSAEVTTIYANNSAKARYVIERLSEVVTPASGATPEKTVSIYRVTSRSTGGSGNAEVVLQVMYTRTTPP